MRIFHSSPTTFKGLGYWGNNVTWYQVFPSTSLATFRAAVAPREAETRESIFGSSDPLTVFDFWVREAFRNHLIQGF